MVSSFNVQSRLLKLIEICIKAKSFATTKLLHAVTITTAPLTYKPIYFYNNVITFYAAVGDLFHARKVFDNMVERDVVSYSTVICAYSKLGYVVEALDLFSAMRGCGIRPTEHTFAALMSCASIGVDSGVQLHGVVWKNGLFCANPFVGTALLNLYGRCGCLEEALGVFDCMPRKSLVTWNSMMNLMGTSGFTWECLHLFRDLMRENMGLSECSFVGVLSGCECEWDLELGQQIHGLLVKSGHKGYASAVNSLLNMYAKCSSMLQVVKLFDELYVRDVYSWNIIVGVLEENEKPELALELFLRMHMDGVLPNQITFVNVLKTCLNLPTPTYGNIVHCKVIKNAFSSDVFVGSSLVDFYAKFSLLGEANRCFDEILEKNMVSWNALISGYAGYYSTTSISLLKTMIQLGYRPNEFTFSSVLKASSVLELQQLHCMVIKDGYENNTYVSSSLMTSFAKNGLISHALSFSRESDEEHNVVCTNVVAGIYSRIGNYHETLKLLSSLEDPDLVSWNIVIAACARSGYYVEVFELFKYMHMIRIRPDKYTFVSLISVCSRLCNLALGSSLHCLLIKTDFSRYDTFVCNVLMDMYSKCGSIESTAKIFNRTSDRNIITWTVLISAFAVNGYASKALDRFKEMESHGLKPNGVAINAALTACRHGGLVTEGLKLFQLMKTHYGVEPKMDHYHSVVDLLARHGHLKQAEKIITSMPFLPSSLIWRSFLECCKRQRSAEDQVIAQAK